MFTSESDAILAIKGQRGERNTPTVYNAAMHFVQFWDGRATDVEDQALKPVTNPVEMALADEAACVAAVKSVPGYADLFKAAFPNDPDPCNPRNISLAIGAFERATVGWFDIASKTYRKIEVNEQCEVLSAIGDIAVGDDGKPSLHVHIVLGLSDGSTRGGHLMAGTVRPTLEVVLTEVPATLRRRKRADLGIALIDLAAARG